MDHVDRISVEAARNARAVASLVRHAITKLDADPASARQYLLNAETLLASPAPPRAQPSGLAPWQAKRVSAYIDSHLGGDHRSRSGQVGVEAGHVVEHADLNDLVARESTGAGRQRKRGAQHQSR